MRFFTGYNFFLATPFCLKRKSRELRVLTDWRIQTASSDGTREIVMPSPFPGSETCDW